MPITNATRRQLTSQGTALAGVWGGPQKQSYYTPSGDEVYAIPAIREWVRKDGRGKIEAQGERDANLDKGWTLTPPTELKIHCAGCDKWHDADEEVEACIDRKRQSEAQWEARARQQKSNPGQGEEVTALTAKVTELTALVEKLLEAK